MKKVFYVCSYGNVIAQSFFFVRILLDSFEAGIAILVHWHISYMVLLMRMSYPCQIILHKCVNSVGLQ